MMASEQKPALEDLHPSLWRASQLARGVTRCVDCGHSALRSQLPGGGWPMGSSVELLASKPGIGEVRLLAPALAKVASRGIVLLQPPHTPQAVAFASLGIPAAQLTWLTPSKTADALWAAETVLNSGAAGALVFWAPHIRNESLRRLHLASQSGDTIFFLVRPLATAQDSSPAPLRLSLEPALDAIEVGVVKRRGPARDTKILVPLAPPPSFTRRNVPQRYVPIPIPQPAAETMPTWGSYTEQLAEG
ncbi:translesion DNA synthesis-associated protein ImuA (plasmid) [Massilia varians]